MSRARGSYSISGIFVVLLDLLSFLVEITGIYFLLRLIKRNHALILLYHGVSSKNISSLENFDGKHIHKVFFEKQLSYLKKHYNIISLDQYVTALKEDQLPHNALAITFDDGYLNNLTVLAPIVKKLKVPVTIFLPVEQIGKGIPWQELMTYCISQTKKQSIALHIKSSKHTYDLSSPQKKLESLMSIKARVHALSDTNKQQVIRQLLKQSKVKVSNISKNKDILSLMSWKDVNNLSKAGSSFISLGSHTLSHPILTQSSPQQLKKELVSSKKILEKKIGREIKHFAYPFGIYNNTVSKAVKTSKYSSALTTDYGYNTQSTSFFKLRRIAVSNNGNMKWFKLSLFFNIGKLLSGISKKYISVKQRLR